MGEDSRDVAGPFWLKEGANLIGSGQRSVVLLPAEVAAAFVGELCLHSGVVTIGAAGEELRLNGGAPEPRPLHADDSPTPDQLSVGRLTLALIRRGERVGVLINDPTQSGDADDTSETSAR